MSQNLAKSYAALGKKVLLVGADLRNPQLHKFLGRQRENIGLSSYLSDESFNDLDALITKADTPGGLDLPAYRSHTPKPFRAFNAPAHERAARYIKTTL